MNIKEQFPKTYEKLKLWVKPKLEAFVQNAPGIENNEPIEITDEWLEKFTDIQIKAYNRSLFDFLDENNIFLTIDNVTIVNTNKEMDIKPSADEWYYVINGKDGDNVFYKNRAEAENAGILEALKRMEEGV